MTAIGVLAQVIMNDGTSYPSHQTQSPPKPYDGKTPPPVKLDEAYSKALSALGDATNQFYCVSATSLNHVPRTGFLGAVDKGWMFVFSNTNGTSKSVCVYFDKTTAVDVQDPAKGSLF